jgi:hypothetical protein
MSGSFYNEKMKTSWILNQYRPDNEKFAPLQSTPFASSSLAATGCNYLAMDYGSQIYGLEKGTAGVTNANINLYSTDKSAVGVEWNKRNMEAIEGTNQPKPKVTVPNVYSLRRSSLLK